MNRIIIGTAGHIDHGKSSLVYALTGTDPDRLPEEKRRRITIDLGYAFLGDDVAIIDVPGHEKFIRNMTAGAATVDYALLIVAADDGVMPQTVEHLHILRLLGVKDGTVVITKIDKVDPEWLDLVDDQINDILEGTFLEAAPRFRVDSLSGKGIQELQTHLITTLHDLKPRSEKGVFRLPVDRVFTVKGRGTVITGTIVSGKVLRGDTIVALPGNESYRVKNVETQSREEAQLLAGQRAALNLLGRTERLQRGQTLAAPDALTVTSRVRVLIESLPSAGPVKNNQRIRFLIGTQEIIGRIQILEENGPLQIYGNILLEKPVVTVWGDRFVLRRYSPLETLGGGRVLEPLTPRFRSRDLREEIVYTESLNEESRKDAVFALIGKRGAWGISRSSVKRQFALTDLELKDIIECTDSGILVLNGLLILRERFGELCELCLSQLAGFHKKTPEKFGILPAELQIPGSLKSGTEIIQHVLSDLIDRGELLRKDGLMRLKSAEIELSPQQSALNESVFEQIDAGGFSPPSPAVIAEMLGIDKSEVMKALTILERLGRLRKLGKDLFFTKNRFDQAVSTIRKELKEKGELSVSEAARIISSSRKYVVPFLEHLDSVGITRREGNVRILGQNSEAS